MAEGETELKLIGVTHVTRLETGFVTKQVRPVFRELEKTGFPRRIGIEQMRGHTLIDRLLFYNKRNPDDRYWKAVYLTAKRRGVKLVPLGKKIRVFNDLQNLLAEIVNSENPAMELGVYKKILFLFPKLSKMIGMVQKNYPRMNRDDVLKLYNALGVYRSVRMHEQAVAQKLTHAVVGINHAENLQALFGARTALLDAPSSKHDLARRLRDYEELEPLIQKLVKN